MTNNYVDDKVIVVRATIERTAAVGGAAVARRADVTERAEMHDLALAFRAPAWGPAC